MGSREVPKCPTCGFLMCEEFDKRRINDIAEVATPNGKFSCCAPGCLSRMTTPKPTPTAPGGDGTATVSLPCPFCGGPATENESAMWVECANHGCPAEPAVAGVTMGLAREGWNQRRSPSTQDTRRAALEEAASWVERWQCGFPVGGPVALSLLKCAQAIRALMEKP